MIAEMFDNPLNVLAHTRAKAANLTAREDLPIRIRERVTSWDLPQEQAAARLGLTRPRLNDLPRGKIDKFALDALVNIATAAGFVLRIHLEEAARRDAADMQDAAFFQMIPPVSRSAPLFQRMTCHMDS